MKKLLVWALAALPILALPTRAWSWGDSHLNIIFHPLPPNWSQLGPWYLYWPMSAHFVAPAPTGYPYWPAAQGLPPGMAIGGPQGPAMPPGGGYAPPGAGFVPPGASYAPPSGSYVPPAQALPPPVPTTTPLPAPVPATQPVRPAGYFPSPSGYAVPSYWYDR
jgi:hypothetical protein